MVGLRLSDVTQDAVTSTFRLDDASANHAHLSVASLLNAAQTASMNWLQTSIRHVKQDSVHVNEMCGKPVSVTLITDQ